LLDGAQLHLAHVGGCALVGVEVRRRKLVDVAGKVRVVQSVEHLPAQLEALGLCQLKHLGKGQVQICQSRQTQVVAPAASVIAEQRLAYRQVRLLLGVIQVRHRVKQRGIAVQGRSHHGVGVRRAVQQRVGNSDELRVTIRIRRTRRDGKPWNGAHRHGRRDCRSGQTGLRAEDGALAPTVQHIFSPAVEAFGKGDVVLIAQSEAVADIKLRVRPLEQQGLRRIQEVRAVAN